MKEGKVWWQNPVVLIAGGIGGGAALIGLSYFVIALGNALGFVLGSVVIGAIHGTVGTVPLKGTTVGVVSLAVLAIAAGVYVTFKVFDRLVKNPFVPLVVVLGVLQTLILDLTRETWPVAAIDRLILKAGIALLFGAASIVWSKGSLFHRLLAVIIYATIPIMVVGVTIKPALNQGIWAALQNIPAMTWLALGIFGGSMAIAMLASKLERVEQ